MAVVRMASATTGFGLHGPSDISWPPPVEKKYNIKGLLMQRAQQAPSPRQTLDRENEHSIIGDFFVLERAVSHGSRVRA